MSISPKRDYLEVLTKRISNMEKCKQSGSLFEGSTWIDINKDLVLRNHLVTSLCEPNKLTATNEHKQVLSTNLTSWIFGSNINVADNGRGGVSLSCPQNIDTNSTPTFRTIQIMSDPTETTHATNKKYVDSEILKNMNHEVNMCSRISVVNPTGDCLRIGRSEGTFIDINVDKDGTLNMTNEKPSGNTNDIDIFGQRINLLSNIDTTSPNTGSLVAFGGVGIMKDLQVGGGIYLRTEEGIPTKLDFYEEGTMPMLWEGIWEDPIDTSIVYQRIGNWVMLMFPYTAGRAVKADRIINNVETYLPKRLRPIYDIKIGIDGTDNDIEVPIKVAVYGDDGRIIIQPKTGNGYSGEGISGFNTFSMQYMVDIVKKVIQ